MTGRMLSNISHTVERICLELSLDKKATKETVERQADVGRVQCGAVSDPIVEIEKYCQQKS